MPRQHITRAHLQQNINRIKSNPSDENLERAAQLLEHHVIPRSGAFYYKRRWFPDRVSVTSALLLDLRLLRLKLQEGGGYAE